MLNVPESVKALFKQDGIRKNFRVHFPGGELPDITNDNVVQESVRFTESLCSQDVLKFGLTEASVLEFETVGVANMYGMTIEAGIEIDLSSLSAAELAEIEAGSWDGVYVSESDTDLGFPFFRVPYGIFRVESCPRDHQAMAHRKVQAYGNNGVWNPFETRKMNVLTGNAQYNPNVYLLFYSLVCWQSDVLILADGFERLNSELPSQTDTRVKSVFAYRNDGTTVSIRLTFYFRKYTTTNSDYLTPVDALYYLDFRNNWDPEQIVSDVANELSQLDIDLTRTAELIGLKDKTFSGLAKSYLSEGSNKPYYKPFITYYTEGNFSGITRDLRSFPIDGENKAIYPKIGDSTLFNVTVPHAIWITADGTTIYNKYTGTQYPVLGRYVPPSGLPADRLLFEKTLTTVYRNVELYSFANAYSLSGFVNSFLELNAQFGATDRSGIFLFKRISNDNPVSLSPGLYSSFWWDEYDVLPIGTVVYKFSNEASDKQDEVSVYSFGEGSSTYDMSDNELLSKLTGATTDSVETMLDTLFIPHLDPIAFTPIDLEMKGLPYLEAGDYLAVTAEDGTIAYSFAMRQTISGIQVLTAEIESTSGDIIESEEGET